MYMVTDAVFLSQFWLLRHEVKWSSITFLFVLVLEAQDSTYSNIFHDIFMLFSLFLLKKELVWTLAFLLLEVLSHIVSVTSAFCCYTNVGCVIMTFPVTLTFRVIISKVRFISKTGWCLFCMQCWGVILLMWLKAVLSSVNWCIVVCKIQCTCTSLQHSKLNHEY